MINWRFYNHAAIPISAPHENVDLSPVLDKSIWRMMGSPLFARWTTDYDCGSETNWWYVVKDTPFDIAELKAKRRYEINKGIKNFCVEIVDPIEYKEELFSVQVEAFSAYPEKYRPKVEKVEFFKSIEQWGEYSIFGCFRNETKELTGYALLAQESDSYIDFKAMKTMPIYEKYGVNAALVEGVLRHYDDFLQNGGYICDGSRSINHETAFQDYLEKYFLFRKAYCHLHIEYNPKIKWLIRILYPMRKILAKLDNIGVIHQVNSVLQMEEICRSEVERK